MAFPDVYPITQFADILPIEKVTFDVLRFDQFDAQGSGHDLTAELADPKWTAEVIMRSLTNAEARRVAALARKRFGSFGSFLLFDPSNPYPAADPKGAIINGGTFTVQILAIGADNQSLSLKGLPPNYKLTIGDKGQISYGDGYNYFFEFSQDVNASAGGSTAVIQVYPHVPPEIVANANVNLKKPACKMAFDPYAAFNPGQVSGNRTSGVRFSAIERV